MKISGRRTQVSNAAGRSGMGRRPLLDSGCCMTAERNPPGERSLLSRPLELLTAAALRAPGWVVAAAVGLTLVAILITGNGLEFKTSRLDLLNAKSAYNQRWLAYLDEFGDRDDAVLVVQAEDPA